MPAGSRMLAGLAIYVAQLVV